MPFVCMKKQLFVLNLTQYETGHYYNENILLKLFIKKLQHRIHYQLTF